MLRGRSTPTALVVAAAAFVFGIGALLVASVTRSPPPGYTPSMLRPGPEPDDLVPERTITLDARDSRRWVRLDLSRGSLVPDEDSAGWDLAVRRFRIVVNGGLGFGGDAGVVRLTDRSLDAVSAAPVEGYVQTKVTAGGDSINAAFEHWYDYGFLSHLLMPKPDVYVVRTTDHRYAKMQIVSYYCPGAEPGCLTLRYVIQGDGSRRLAP